MAYSVSSHEFVSISENWMDLLPYCANDSIFLTPMWQNVWWRLMGVGELRILKVLQDDVLIGIAPMKKDSSGWSFLGDTSVFDYQDFIVRDGCEDSFFEALLEYLEKEQWENLTLVSLREGSLTLQSLPRLAKQRGYDVVLDLEDVSPGVYLSGTFDDYVSGLSKKDRHELRRKIRRLDTAGDYRTLSFQNAEDLPSAMDEFLMLMRRSRTDKDQFLTPERENFFRNMVQELAGARQIQLYFLEVNGSRVAGALCFDYQGRRFLYNSGYDLDYSSLSVGLLLKAFCLRDAIDQGMVYFDFLRGTEPYKYNLGAADVPLYQMTLTRPLLPHRGGS